MELICTKRDSGTKFASPEFCVPFTQTVDRPVCHVNGLFFIEISSYSRAYVHLIYKRKAKGKRGKFPWDLLYKLKWSIASILPVYVARCITSWKQARSMSLDPNKKNRVFTEKFDLLIHNRDKPWGFYEKTSNCMWRETTSAGFDFTFGVFKSEFWTRRGRFSRKSFNWARLVQNLNSDIKA